MSPLLCKLFLNEIRVSQIDENSSVRVHILSVNKRRRSVAAGALAAFA
jgi:hypothetical protein